MPELYNQQKKEAFIEECVNTAISAKQCRYLFKKFSKFEESWGADLSTASKEQLEQALESTVGVRSASNWVFIRYLRMYVTWCKESGDPSVSDAIFHVRVEALDKIRTMTVSRPEHLQQCLDEIYEPVEEKTVDITYRAYFWLAYAGMKEDDILKVKCSDVDFNSMQIHYEGQDYPIYPPAVLTLRIASRFPALKYRHPNYKSDVYRDRADGNTLVRGFRQIRNIVSYRQSLSRSIKDALEDGRTQSHLSYSRVWMSGLFWRAYENELDGIEADFEQESRDYMAGKEFTYDNIGNPEERKRRRIARDYAEDYRRWKLAWELTE